VTNQKDANLASPLCLWFIILPLLETLAKLFFFNLCCSLAFWGDGCVFSDPKNST
jgi:hypothetical protein